MTDSMDRFETASQELTGIEQLPGVAERAVRQRKRGDICRRFVLSRDQTRR